jgi:general secretion pathway protein A
MYTQHWGLARHPFENRTSAEFFYRSGTHQANLLKLRYVVENGLGAGLLAGGIGYGKTFLANQLCHDLPDEFGPCVEIVFPQLTAPELFAYLAVELGADETRIGRGSGEFDRTIRQIEQRLESLSNEGKHPIIIIDEAHLIEDSQVLQTLQLLLNFQQRPNVAFTLLLVGERPLLGQVGRIAALDARIGVKALLKPLSYDETIGYVQHRLQVAGATDELFDQSALDSLFELSGGVPRQINRLCDLSLLVGFAERLHRLTADEVADVDAELTALAPN